MADFVAVSRETGEYGVVEELLELVLLETTNSTDRHYGDRWEDKRGLAPVIVQDGANDSAVLQAPSLLLALWLTSILTDQFAAELASIEGDEEEKSGEKELPLAKAMIGKWLGTLVQHWSHVLRSAAVPAKLCATQVILSIVQGIVSTTGNLRLPHSYTVTILQHLDYTRLCRHALARLDAERGMHPVCSEYLQALVELTSVMHHCQTLVGAGLGDKNKIGSQPPVFPALKSAIGASESESSSESPVSRRQRAPSIVAELSHQCR